MREILYWSPDMCFQSLITLNKAFIHQIEIEMFAILYGPALLRSEQTTTSFCLFKALVVNLNFPAFLFSFHGRKLDRQQNLISCAQLDK